MQLLKKLKDKKVKVMEIPQWGTYLRKQWEDKFANHLSDSEKREIYMYDCNGACGYLWHIFSYEKKECLVGKDAEQAFMDEEKKACYIFYQHSDYAFILKDASVLEPSDLLGEGDVYVVDREFSWTYVNTHENGWLGPYFGKNNDNYAVK
ncbi:DUF4275 family protein [Clostridium thermarum]|uniref:DUF4275 family protein n=1 Tax=Clostridium thermarum TaxID=1716543 RepID=UPI0011232F80|nr:DUF4275 family protein [Clostridium thermarum]